MEKTKGKKITKTGFCSQISFLDFPKTDRQFMLVTVYFGCGLYQKGEVEIQSADPKLKKTGKWMCSYIFYIKIKCVSYEYDFIWLFLIDLFQLTDRPPYQWH